MPIFTYYNPETDITWDELWPYVQHKQFLEDNQNIQTIIHAPSIISGIAGVTHKNDSGFNDMMSRIGQANPYTPLAEKYGDKGVKATKTRDAVKRVKNKVGGPLT
jgi:hypothetical protein